MAWGMVDRIGGPDRLRAIVERFYQRMAGDSIVGFFFAGRDLQKILQRGCCQFHSNWFGKCRTCRLQPVQRARQLPRVANKFVRDQLYNVV